MCDLEVAEYCNLEKDVATMEPEKDIGIKEIQRVHRFVRWLRYLWPIENDKRKSNLFERGRCPVSRTLLTPARTSSRLERPLAGACSFSFL